MYESKRSKTIVTYMIEVQNLRKSNESDSNSSSSASVGRLALFGGC